MIFSGNRSFRAFFLPCLEKNVEMKAFMTHARTLVHTHAFTHKSKREKEKENERERKFLSSILYRFRR